MKFLVFSDDWGVHPSSCQHIFRVLAPDHETVWVNTVGMRPPRLSLQDAKKAIRKVSSMLGLKRRAPHQTVADNSKPAENRHRELVQVCSPPMLPFHRPRPLIDWNFRSIERTVRRALGDTPAEELCVVTTVPNVFGAVRRFGARSVVYYCVDDFSEWPGLDRDVILEMERQLLPNVDRIICTSQALFDRFEADYPSRLLPHGVDLRLYREGVRQPEHALLASIPEPRVGYFGLLDDRTDRELVLAVARAIPEVSFVFTGPTEGDLREWNELPNVHLTGPVPYAELPSLVRGWQACILPYRINETTRTINPLKLKEYLAGGRPVLTTPLAEACKLDEHLRVEHDVKGWTRAIREAVRGEWRVEHEKTDAFLRGESWERKAAEFLEICEET